MPRDARGLRALEESEGVVHNDRQGQEQSHGVRRRKPARPGGLALQRQGPSDKNNGQASTRQRPQPAIDDDQVKAVRHADHARRHEQRGERVEDAGQQAAPEACEDRPPCAVHPASSATGRAVSNRAVTARRSAACFARARSGSSANTASADLRAISTRPT